MLQILALVGALACVAAAAWLALVLFYRLSGQEEEWEEYP